MKRMTSLRRALLTGVLLAGGGLAAACGSQHYGYSYVSPPPAPVSMGVVGYAPGPGYGWVSGYWDLRGGRWFWVGGRWARCPRPRALWVSGYWSPYRHSYRWHRGYWR